MSDVRRVLLVEDHPVFRLGLRELIEQEADLAVAGEAGGVEEALSVADRTAPDVAVVDLALDGEDDGIDLVARLAGRTPPVPALVVSMYDEALYAERALAAGARGYLMKHETSESIIGAIRRVLGGGFALSEGLTAVLVGRAVGGPAAAPPTPEDRLTPREREVLGLIGRGLTTGQIAERLHLSVKTVGTHRERIKEKLGLATAAELTRHAVRWLEGGCRR